MTEISTRTCPKRPEQLDQDQLQPDTYLDDRGVDDALDEGYSPAGELLPR